MPEIKQLPYFLDLNNSYQKIEANSSPFILGFGWEYNANGNLNTGTGNQTGEGQNQFVLTPTRANVKLQNQFLPDGFNKNVGCFESLITKELYYFNYNENNKHGVYVINGDTLDVIQVIIDENLEFSLEQDAFITENRVTLRVVYDEDKNIIEKHLIFTNGKKSQKWINVIASIKTNGFDSNLFPYWRLRQPHFDRKELLEYATRPPMFAPIVVAINNTDEDVGLENRLVDTAFQFCYEFQYTDGRFTTVSPYSLAYWIKKEDFLSSVDSIPKKLSLELYAGSCMVEKIVIYVRQSVSIGNSSDLLNWGNWYKYDVIDRFTNCGNNDSKLIKNDYWLRTNEWENYEFNSNKNTIKYIFKNDRLGQIVDQKRIARLQTDMPLRSVAMSDLGDGIILGNNEYGFDNFSCETTSALDVKVYEDEIQSCSIPLRKIALYVYAGRDRAFNGNESSPQNRDIWLSQFGYVNGNDTKVRWGGIWYEAENKVSFDIVESDLLNVNFGNNKGFRCYLKGTPYYSECEWHIVDENFNLKKLDKILDCSNESDRNLINSVFSKNGFFVGKFEFNVPAGKYIATIGRHDANDDFRLKSTYIMGIANSRNISFSSYGNCGGHTPFAFVKTIKPNAIVSASKELEINCINNDVDVWGNGEDLFYICTPFNGAGRPIGRCDGAKRNRWRFIEGYLYESASSKIPVERFSYTLTNFRGNCGNFTDKNGFFWGYTFGRDDEDKSNIVFINNRINCQTKNFTVTINNNQPSAGWFKDLKPTLSDYNNGEVGVSNRIKVVGKITDLSGNVGYSNIAVTMRDSAVVYTKNDGTFTLILHNGLSNFLQGNIYFNAAGNFNIIGENCQPINTFYFDESIVSCNQLNANPCDSSAIFERYYPVCINLRILVSNLSYQSIKSNGKYEVGIVGADLAGRLTFVNKFKEITIPSFLSLNKIVPFYLKWFSNGKLSLPKDIKWLAFYISKNISYNRYIQWVGDSISFIDNLGNITTDTSNASLASIKIDSLLQTNIKSNFSVFSNYQFQKGDRIKILDDGDGILLGQSSGIKEPIDLIIEGTNYNDAAISAGLLPQNNNVVVEVDGAVTIVVKYTSELERLKDKNGFWIELYNSDKIQENLVYYEIESFYPVVNGEIAKYESGDINAPVYSFPLEGKLNYWDTYLFNRAITIPNFGNKYISHPFESPNITDRWGANIIGGGRTNIQNENAERRWFVDDIIKSGDFSNDGLVNNLGYFISSNRKSFKGYKWGGIVAIKAINSYIFFLCENDYFTTDYNYHYARPNQQGVMVVNLNNDVSEPHQKIGNNRGCDIKDIATIIMHEDFICWHDRKNGCYAMSDYKNVIDITESIDAYYSAKNSFVNTWNENVELENRFDTIAGIDLRRKLIYVTFRPRRNNSNDLYSFVNQRRNLQLDYQETLVYNISAKKWVRLEHFTPESYAKLRSNSQGEEMFTFALGEVYAHLNTPNNKFSNFYGINCVPCFICVLNIEPETTKILQSVSQQTNDSCLWVDMIYSTAPNSFSYIPLNYFVKRDGIRYATVLRDGSTFPPINKDELFRNMFFDGKKMVSTYFVIRYILDKNEVGNYVEINNINSQIIPAIQKTQ